MTITRLILHDVSKAFTLHLREGLRLPVVNGVALALSAGECIALTGRSGSGKSTILRMIHGNYRIDEGQILVIDGENMVDLATASPRRILALRRTTIGYVSQFLRAVPRIPAIDVVAEPLRLRGVEPAVAKQRAGALLNRLSIPERLWTVPPATFSGGEQQRVNIARGLIADFPILLLDEPTASLDIANCDVVAGLIDEKRTAGAAILTIIHDPRIRERLASREIDVGAFAAAA